MSVPLAHSPSLTERLIERGILECQTGSYRSAVRVLGRAAHDLGTLSNLPPKALASYGLALANADIQRAKDAIGYCKMALARDARDPELYQALVKVYLLLHQKSNAVRVLDQGLSNMAAHPELLRQRCELGWRSPPTLRFLPRDHPLNKLLGRLRNSLRSS